MEDAGISIEVLRHRESGVAVGVDDEQIEAEGGRVEGHGHEIVAAVPVVVGPREPAVESTDEVGASWLHAATNSRAAHSERIDAEHTAHLTTRT